MFSCRLESWEINDDDDEKEDDGDDDTHNVITVVCGDETWLLS
jgi:hypothetical protein